jgi:NTP pyrophosphatase (non-canonical NTP hydrolase)
VSITTYWIVELERLRQRLQKFGADRDWDQFHNPKDLAVSVSIEAAELLELFQWLPADQPVDEAMKAAIADEAADVFMYLTLLCQKTGIDLIDATHAKLDKNEKRFPVLTSRGVAKPRKTT